MGVEHSGMYVRISDDKVGAGLGVERQEKDCRTVAARLGWPVEKVYVDNDLTAYDKSGKAKPRPGYEQLKTDVAAGLIDGVIVWHTDRLHRTPRELEDFIDLAEQAGLAVETVKSGVVDLGTPSGRAVARTLCAWAYYESEHKSERAKAKYVQLAEAGLPSNGGYRPFGYTKDRMQLVDEEAVTIRWAYAQVLTGRSLRSIAKDLNDQGARSTTGRPWSVQALRLNLLSPRNVALREHRGEIVGPAAWPPLIDRETWDRVRALLTAAGRAPARRDGTPAGNGRKHLLTGFLFCGKCGGKLCPRTSGKIAQRYGCLPRGEGGCAGTSVYLELTEQTIEHLVLARLERDVDLQPDAVPDPTSLLLEQIATDEQRLKDLAAAFADDLDGNPLELRAAGARIRRRISEAREAIRSAAVAERLNDPLVVRFAWPRYDLQQRRQVINQLIERIDVGPGTPGRFDFDRFTVVWR